MLHMTLHMIKGGSAIRVSQKSGKKIADQTSGAQKFGSPLLPIHPLFNHIISIEIMSIETSDVKYSRYPLIVTSCDFLSNFQQKKYG